jgi:hypothetical protein
MLSRKRVLLGLGAAGLAVALPAGAAETRARWLTRVNPRWVVTEDEAIAWHRVKDELGPALTGTASWRQFLAFVEAKLGEYGCVNLVRAPWMFTRLETSTWPDNSKWSLISNGRAVALSNFGANCGLTGPDGITAPLVLWDPETRPDIAGKIVVFRPVPRPRVRDEFINSDYEYRTPYDSRPIEGTPVPQDPGATQSISPIVWDDMTSTSLFIRDVREMAPAGVVFATNLNRAAAAGLHMFPVPDHYGFPSVYVDRAAGDAIIADARENRLATIRVEGEHVQSEAYQLIAYLPGRDYGTDRDEQIQMRTHTDGPSISQDDGAFGLLGVVKYMSHIPRRERPRTILLELDCRHFMPGAERRWAEEDYFAKHPSARDRVVALIAMEHLGQIEYAADGEDIRPTGRALQTLMYASANQLMIEQARQAALDNNVRAAVLRSPGRPGVHGATQGPWYGMSRAGAQLGLPTFGVQGDLGAYWAISGRMERFDPRSFTRQVATFAQLTGFLMCADLDEIASPAPELPPSNALR